MTGKTEFWRYPCWKYYVLFFYYYYFLVKQVAWNWSFKKEKQCWLLFQRPFQLVHVIIYKMRHISIAAILEWTKLVISLSSLVCLIWTAVRGWVHAWHFFCTKMSKAMPAWAPLWETSKIHSVCSWATILTFNILTKYITTSGLLLQPNVFDV